VDRTFFHGHRTAGIRCIL